MSIKPTSPSFHQPSAYESDPRTPATPAEQTDQRAGEVEKATALAEARFAAERPEISGIIGRLLDMYRFSTPHDRALAHEVCRALSGNPALHPPQNSHTAAEVMRLREALSAVANQDEASMIVDPLWAKRCARAALGEGA